MWWAEVAARNDSFSNMYNDRWRNQPNFLCKDQGVRPMGPPGFQNLQLTAQFPPQPAKEKKSNLKEMMLQYIQKMDQRMDQF